MWRFKHNASGHIDEKEFLLAMNTPMTRTYPVARKPRQCPARRWQTIIYNLSALNTLSVLFSHLLLLACWSTFAIIHHVMANEPFKNRVGVLLGEHFRYYRLIYSMVACISLAAVLCVQFSIASPVLSLPVLLIYLLAIPLGATGLWLMAVCIMKYFYRLSGVSALSGKKAGAKLEVTGIHRHVRHPLYLGTLLLVTALFFVFPLVSNLICCLSILSYVLVGIRSEERKLVDKFGEEYITYKNRTPMLFPRLN